MRHIIALTLTLAAMPAAAEVKSSAAGGFEVESVVTVPVPPAEAYAALGRINRWWVSSHTYSGDAANLSIELRAGACFCERVPEGNGSIEHGRVVYAQPGQALRVSGALGPLQAEGVSGALTWTLTPSGSGTEIRQSYVVGGYVRGGAERLAPLVDQVMAGQLEGLRQHLAR